MGTDRDIAMCFNRLLPFATFGFPSKSFKFDGSDPFALRGTIYAFGAAFLPWRTYAKFIKVKRSFNRPTPDADLIRRGLRN